MSPDPPAGIVPPRLKAVVPPADVKDMAAFSTSPHRVWTRAALALWAVVCVLGGGALLAFHLVSLPVPPVDDPVLQAALAAQSTSLEQGRWRLVHVMYARCPCSQQIIDHLVNDPRPGDVAERVVIVDADDALRARLAGAGFLVDVVDANTLQARWHLEAAPVLVVADPAGRVRYVGGYTDRKQGPVSHDVDILEQVRRGDGLQSLPLFGCATSRSLQRTIDPLGVRRLLDAFTPRSEPSP